MTKNSAYDFARECVSKGYRVIPTKTDGSPLFTGWWDHDAKFQVRDVDAWERCWPLVENFSLVMGGPEGEEKLCVFDVDVEDEAIARKIRDHFAELFPRRLERTRTGSSRFAVFVAAAKGTSPEVVRARSRLFAKEGASSAQCIEFFSEKKSLAVFGSHRKDSSSIYSFRKGFSPADIPFEELSAFKPTAPILKNIFEHFYSLVEDAGWGKLKLRREYFGFAKKGVKTEDPFDLAQEKFENDVRETQKTCTPEEMDFVLRNIDGNDYDQWLSVGMCFYNHYRGSLEGAEKWDEWSREFSEKYDGKQSILKKYSTFSVSGGMSFDSMFRKLSKEVEVPKELVKKIAEKEGEKKINEEPLVPDFLGLNDLEIVSGKEHFDHMVENFLFIAKGRGSGDEPCIADLSKEDLNDAVISRKQMREYWKPTKATVRKIGKRGLPVLEKVPVFDLWYESPQRRKAWGVVYAPDKPKVFFSQDMEYLNSYIPPDVTYTEDTHKLHYFINHLEYLFPLDKGAWFTNWLAQLIQEPHKRYRTNPLSISLHEGTGRGWLTTLLTKLVGVSNFSAVDDLGSIVENPKNHYLKDSLLVVFNEVYTPKFEKQRILSRLKTYFSDDVQPIDEKYGKQSFNVRIYCRFFLQSNRLYGLPIEYEDTRIQPFINRTPPKDQEYYTTIYNLLDGDRGFLNQVYSYLKRVKINYEWLQKSLNTADRQTILRSSVTLTSMGFSIFRSIVGEDSAFTEDDLSTFVENLVQASISSSTGFEGMGESNKGFNFSEFVYLKGRFLVDMPPTILYKGEHISLRSFQVLDESLTRSELVEKLETTRKKVEDSLKDGGYSKWMTRRVNEVKEEE